MESGNDAKIQVIVFEGGLKRLVVRSESPNVAESVTKKRVVEGVIQLRMVLKRGVKYMVEISGRGEESFGTVGQCEYAKVHVSVERYGETEGK